MAKIHIRGGSPLSLTFEDLGQELEVQLIEKPGAGHEYNVKEVKSQKLLDTKPGAGNYVFRTSGPDKKTVVVDYKT